MVARLSRFGFAMCALGLWSVPVAGWAQSITPAEDGTGTVVNQVGDRYTITGGSLSADEANLFHSFEQLGLEADEIATFLSQPNIDNILGRVVGGDASFIDGLIQLQGGTSNLYLMNPAGIVFGPNASLDLPASFFATTANGIGFGENWFDAVGDNTYADLVGTPDSFAFSLAEPGAIANLANLAVNPGESLTLLGGTVTNTGTLTAPGGTITLAAVPGENRVRLSQAGSLLSLELDAANGTWDTALAPSTFTPLALPELLTGGDLQPASQIVVNPDGTIQLAGATVPVEAGTTLVSGTLDASGTAEAEINVLGDRVALLDATLDGSGTNGGGTLRIGGDYRGTGSVFNASRTVVSADSVLAANTEQEGNGGRVMVWADTTTQFLGTVLAQGGTLSGDGGFVEVSGAQSLLFDGLVDVMASNGQIGTLLLDPLNITISNEANSPGVAAALPDIFAAELPGDLIINAATLENQAGNVILEATENITIADGLSLNFVPGGSITLTADANSDGIGAFVMDPTQTIFARGNAITNGRDVTISGAQVTVGTIDTSIDAIGSTTNSGNIQISSSNGDITADSLRTTLFNGLGNAGSITLNTNEGDIVNNFSNTFAANGSGGDVVFTTINGDITVGSISTFSNTTVAGSGGADISLQIRGTGNILTTGELDSSVFNRGSGGNITLTTANGNITSDNLFSVSRVNDDGNIQLEAGGVGNAGVITLNGEINAVDGINFSPENVTAGNITLTANEMNFLGGANSISAGGQLLLQPSTPATPITLGGVADSAPTTLDLLAADLATLQNGFSSITIGRTNGSGRITLAGNVVFSDPVRLRSPLAPGSINTTGGTITGLDDATITLEAAGDITTAAITTQGRDITLASTRGNITTGILNTIGSTIAPAPTVLYDVIGRDFEITSPQFTNVSDGTFNGNVATVAPGSTLTLSGNYRLIPTDTSFCPGCIIQAYTAWIPPAPVGSQGFYSGGSAPRTGTFNWTTTAPTTPGRYNIGLGFTLDFVFQPDRIGVTGVTPDGVEASSFQVTVGNPLVTSGNIRLDAAGRVQTGAINTSNLAINSGGASIDLNGAVTVADDIALTANEINVTNPVSGSGALTLQPATRGQAIALAGTDNTTAALDLTAAELAQIQPGFRNITLGLTNGTGSVTLNPFNFNAPTTLAGGSTLTVLNQENRWSFTGSNQGTVNGTEFTNFQRFEGSLGDNIVELADGLAFGGNISAGTGNLTIQGPSFRLRGDVVADGDINITGTGDVAVESAIASTTGGIQLISDSGSLDTTQGTLDTSASGEAIALTAPISLAVGNVLTNGPVTLNTDGTLDLSTSNLGRQDPTAATNTPTISIGNDRVPEAIRFAGDHFFSNGGDVRINASGDYQLETEINTAGASAGGLIDIRSDRQLTLTRNLITRGGRISLSGSSVTAQVLDSRFEQGGGRISVTATDADIVTSNIDAAATGDGNGGDVEVNAITAITTGTIDTSSAGGNGGNVTLDPIDDIEVEWINTSSSSGRGGNVDITAGRFFRATGSFLSSLSGREVSISTEGQTEGGSITIRHGGDGVVPFVIGSNFDANGTRAAVVTGTASLDEGESFLEPITRGNITLETATRSSTQPSPTLFQNLESDTSDEDTEEDETEEATEAAEEEETVSFADILVTQENLNLLQQQLGISPALIYVSFGPTGLQFGNDFERQEATASTAVAQHLNQRNPVASPLLNLQPQASDELELLIVTGLRDPVRIRVEGVTRQQVLEVQNELMREVNNPSRLGTRSYLPSAQQLYDWLIRPMEETLTEQQIGNLAFIMGEGLRTLPIAVLHDKESEQFLVERYSVGMMPSLSLTDTRYVDIRNLPVLAMGASRFDALPPLPAVPSELEVIASSALDSVALLNDEFTQANLLQIREERPFGIVHMATHARFLPGALENSYIEFGDRRLTLDQVRQLGLNDPSIELLVLSACETAVGDPQAELGFGGLAVQIGARSVLASLWSVDDTGTLVFMTEFYRQLRQAPFRADALRQTQIAFLRGEARLEDGQMVLPDGSVFSLPIELRATSNLNLRHPYYWSAFTMIGSPW